MGLQVLLNHAEPIAEPLRNLCVFPAPRNHCLGVLTSSCVCCCNLCTTFCRLRAYGPTSVQSTSAISFAGRTPTCGAPACFGATSLAWPVRPEPPFNTDIDVIFRYHSDSPEREVISYHKFCRATRGVPVSGWIKVIGCAGRHPPLLAPEFCDCLISF